MWTSYNKKISDMRHALSEDRDFLEDYTSGYYKEFRDARLKNLESRIKTVADKAKTLEEKINSGTLTPRQEARARREISKLNAEQRKVSVEKSASERALPAYEKFARFIESQDDVIGRVEKVFEKRLSYVGETQKYIGKWAVNPIEKFTPFVRKSDLAKIKEVMEFKKGEATPETAQKINTALKQIDEYESTVGDLKGNEISLERMKNKIQEGKEFDAQMQKDITQVKDKLDDVNKRIGYAEGNIKRMKDANVEEKVIKRAIQDKDYLLKTKKSLENKLTEYDIALKDVSSGNKILMDDLAELETNVAQLNKRKLELESSISKQKTGNYGIDFDLKHAFEGYSESPLKVKTLNLLSTVGNYGVGKIKQRYVKELYEISQLLKPLAQKEMVIKPKEGNAIKLNLKETGKYNEVSNDIKKLEAEKNQILYTSALTWRDIAGGESINPEIVKIISEIKGRKLTSKQVKELQIDYSDFLSEVKIDDKYLVDYLMPKTKEILLAEGQMRERPFFEASNNIIEFTKKKWETCKLV